VGTVNIPRDTETGLPPGINIDVGVSDNDGTDPTVTSTSIISVTLTDLYGTEVALTGEVELCFSSSLANIEGQCLGFLNEQNQWECQDECLEPKNGQLCGTTTHFTNFALLLGGGGDACGTSAEEDYVIAILSGSFIAAAFLIVLASGILVEVRLLIKRKQRSGKRGPLVVVIEK